MAGITYTRNGKNNDSGDEGSFEGGRAVSPEEKSVNQSDFAEAVGGATPVSVGQLAFRFIELLVAVASLALLAPILVLTAIAIKLDSRGSILVRQAPYGFKNRMIQVCKFKAPTVGAKREQSGPRLTRVGLLVRTTGIEELPMLINIEVSIVGPPPSGCPSASLNERKSGIIRWAEMLSSQSRTPD